MRRACPIAANACFSAILRGRRCIPITLRPVAIAPEDTRITSFPSAFRSEITRTSFSIFRRSRLPVSLWVMLADPTLITIRFFSFRLSLIS